MSALNRSMFKKQIVNREEGSPLEGEDSSGGVLQALLQSIKNLATDGFTMNDTEMLDESKQLIDQGRDHVLNEFEFSLLYPGVSFDSVTIEERTIGANSKDMNTLIEKEAQLREQEPDISEGEEGYQYDFDIDGKNKSFGFDEKLAPSGVESFREKLGITADPNSVLREGELMNMRSIPRSVLREGELMNMMDPNSV
jgi:hypothetical protein